MAAPPSPAAAEPGGYHRDLPDKLLAQGLALKRDGHLDEGCARIQDSYAMNRGFGAQRELVDCRAKLGLPGRAALDLAELSARLATALAQPGISPDRKRQLEKIQADTAPLATEIDGQLPSLPDLTLRLGEEARSSPGFTVEIDGVALDKARWDSKIPLDRGRHLITAHAHEKRRAVIELDVVGGSYVERLDRLEDAAPEPSACPTVAPGAAVIPTAALPTTAASSAASATASPATAPAPPPAPLTAREIAIGAGLSVGAAGLALGLGYGVAFEMARADYNPHNCPRGAEYCTDGRSSDKVYADTLQLRSTEIIALLTGGAGVVAAGLVWWLLPPAPGRSVTVGASSQLGPRRGGFVLSGSF
jgi:hypothetical protein